MIQIARRPTHSMPLVSGGAFGPIDALPGGVAFARPYVEMVLAMFAGMVLLTSSPLSDSCPLFAQYRSSI
jgi:hypothetical protein